MAVAAKHTYQDYDPRQRLTGAVVLILFAIVLLPMLLSNSPDSLTPEQADPVVMEVTKNGKNVFVSRISSTTADNSDAGHNSGLAEKKAVEKDLKTPPSSVLFRPMQQPDVKSATPAKTTTKSTSRAPAKKDTAKKSEKTKSVAKSSKPVPVTGWILQVGVFSQSANASKKVSELKKKGFTAHFGKVKSSKGTVTKVWIGPFKDRKAAEKMQERLQHKTRQRGIVVKK